MTKSEEAKLGEIDWKNFTRLRVVSGKLLIMDPIHVDKSEDGLLVELPEEEYDVMIAEDPWMGITRLRVVSPGSVPELGRKLGEVCTDIASVGVCDGEAFEELAKSVDVEELWDIRQPAFDVDYCDVVVLKKDLEVPVAIVNVRGDGTYPVFELLSASKRIGAEVEFHKPGESDDDFW